MKFFDNNTEGYFDQAKWERQKGKPKEEILFESESADGKQFILMQLAGGDQRVLSSTDVTPALEGKPEKPDINMTLDFDSFQIGSNEGIDKDTRATLQLQIGQEETRDSLDKLFYCINGGLDLFNEIKGKASEAKDFKKSTAAALGKKPISMPKGIGEISLKVLKHETPTWWQRVFKFAQSDTGKELFSLVGFPGITEGAVKCVSNMLDTLLDKNNPEPLFQSRPIKAAFTKAAQQDLNGGLDINRVSCLNPGFWIMARAKDYDEIIRLKPIYYGGYGLLAPESMKEPEVLKDKSNNPFTKITYAIIRVRMAEVDLRQGMVL